MHGILRLRAKIQGNPPAGWRERYGAIGTEEVVGPDDLPGAGAVNVFQSGETQRG